MGIQVLGLLGEFSVGVAMIVLARLSQKLGKVTHVRSYHIGLYIAAGCVWLGMLNRLYFITIGSEPLQAPKQNVMYTLLSDGLLAFGVTLGLVITWYYWSWLLAERN